MFTIDIYKHIKNQNEFDRTLGWTSIYIIIPSFYTNIIFLKIGFSIAVFASFSHWLLFNNLYFHILDIILVKIIILYHLILLYNQASSSHKFQTIFFIFLSITFFIYGKGRRELFIKNKNKNKNSITNFINFKLILPHALFRFFIFWFIMYTHNQIWSWKITTIYWINILILSRDHFSQIKTN